jgi:N-terminal domain of NWD NACHT-NTPase
MDGQDPELERKLQELAERKWKEVKSGLEIFIGDWRINIKDPACKAIHMIIAYQGIIGDVVSVEPHAALAWTGVVAILPVSVKCVATCAGDTDVHFPVIAKPSQAD